MAGQGEAGVAAATQRWPSWRPEGLSGTRGEPRSRGGTGLHDGAPGETVSD